MGQGITNPPPHERPNGSLYLGSDQLNLVDNNWNDIDLDTIKANFTDGIENTGTHRITPVIPGFYAITAQVRFTNVPNDKALAIRVLIDSVAIMEAKSTTASSSSSITVRASEVCYVGGSTILKLMAQPFVIGGNTVDVVGGNEYETFLTVQRCR